MKIGWPDWSFEKANIQRYRFWFSGWLLAGFWLLCVTYTMVYTSLAHWLLVPLNLWLLVLLADWAVADRK